jgi:hypothetical protein
MNDFDHELTVIRVHVNQTRCHDEEQEQSHECTQDPVGNMDSETKEPTCHYAPLLSYWYTV